MKLPWL